MFNSVDCRNNEKGMLWKVIKVCIYSDGRPLGGYEVAKLTFDLDGMREGQK